jgi:hypothetical protein
MEGSADLTLVQAKGIDPLHYDLKCLIQQFSDYKEQTKAHIRAGLVALLNHHRRKTNYTRFIKLYDFCFLAMDRFY